MLQMVSQIYGYVVISKNGRKRVSPKTKLQLVIPSNDCSTNPRQTDLLNSNGLKRSRDEGVVTHFQRGIAQKVWYYSGTSPLQYLIYCSCSDLMSGAKWGSEKSSCRDLLWDSQPGLSIPESLFQQMFHRKCLLHSSGTDRWLIIKQKWRLIPVSHHSIIATIVLALYSIFD